MSSPQLVLPVTALSLFAILVTGCSSPTSTSTPASTSTSSTAVPPAVTAKARFVYTGNQGASLSGYSVNTSTGALTSLSGFPLALGTNPTAITRDPQNRFVIVADIAADKLLVLSIDNTTGALTQLTPNWYATIREPSAVVTDPSGAHVYVASQYGNQLAAYVLSSTGTLTAVGGSPFSTGSTASTAHVEGAAAMIIDAAGKFLFVQDLANIYAFSIDANSGALTLIQTAAGPHVGGGLALSPTGNYLYAVASGTNSILTYNVDTRSGTLTQVKSSPMLENNGAYTISIAPNGQSAYTIENNNYLVAYTINNGAFTPIGTAYSGVYGDQIAVDPSGGFVYVPQACSTCPTGVYNVVHEFSIGPTGALTPLPASPVPAGTTPWGITITSQ